MQSEMFPDLPTIKMPKRLRSKWEDLNELCDLVDKHGPLLPMEMAADLLDVHRSRVYQLVDAGTLEAVEFRGRRFITEQAIRGFVEVERKAGRPSKNLEEMSVKDIWKMSVKTAKGAVVARQAVKAASK